MQRTRAQKEEDEEKKKTAVRKKLSRVGKKMHSDVARFRGENKALYRRGRSRGGFNERRVYVCDAHLR